MISTLVTLFVGFVIIRLILGMRYGRGAGVGLGFLRGRREPVTGRGGL